MRRINHAVLALMVLFQMIDAEWMTKPWKAANADSSGRLFYTLHEWAGLIAAAALAGVVWRLFRLGELPHADAATRATLLAQCRTFAVSLMALRVPRAEETAALAHAVQALGLLLTCWLCATGGAIWLVGDTTETAHRIGELHELAVPLLYAYVGGHVGMALLHRFLGRTH